MGTDGSFGLPGRCCQRCSGRPVGSRRSCSWSKLTGLDAPSTREVAVQARTSTILMLDGERDVTDVEVFALGLKSS
jgi:hypothetical protein